MPSSRCTTVSASRRSSARSEAGTPTSSLITSIGSRPAKSEMKSKLPRSTAGSRCSTASWRMRGSSSATRRGVKLLPTSERSRVWPGGSMARNDIDRWAWGPKAAGSSDTP